MKREDETGLTRSTVVVGVTTEDTEAVTESAEEIHAFTRMQCEQRELAHGDLSFLRESSVPPSVSSVVAVRFTSNLRFRPMTRFSLLPLAGALLFAGCAGATAGGRGGSAPQLAITMDDLPVHGPLPAGETRTSVAERIVAAFRAAGVPEVYGFINAADVEGDADREGALAAWVAAGYPLGNHTWSHPNLNQLSVADFEAEIVRNEAALQRFAGSLPSARNG